MSFFVTLQPESLKKFVAEAPNGMIMFDRDIRFMAASRSWMAGKGLKESPLGRDCLELARRSLLEKEWLSQAEVASWHDAVETEVEETVAKVLREPAPDPAEEDWNAFSVVGRNLSGEDEE